MWKLFYEYNKSSLRITGEGAVWIIEKHELYIIILCSKYFEVIFHKSKQIYLQHSNVF
jgi:hypothetical protein